MISFSRTALFFLLLIFAGCKLAFSQNSESYLYENEFDLGLPLRNNWSMVIGFANRGMVQERLEGERISGYQHEHLEFNHFTGYQTSEALVVSMGLRYRFRELFNTSETDEFRIIEQIEFEPANSPLQLSHRLRVEQRFREHTIHRVRYDVEISRPLNEVYSIGAGTEALYAVSSQLKPEVEQRFSIGLENTSFRNLELELDFEYRLENYARSPSHEFFIITGVTLDL